MSQSETSRQAGIWGEKQAEKFLRSKGYKILGTRVRVGQHDELDLVVRDGDVLVFVEVKTRKGALFGRPASSIDSRKRRALSRGAVQYMRSLRQMPDYFRFDVVEVVGEMDDGIADIRHIERAFTLDSRYRLVY